ncbi:MAG: NGG1p interacting factor NIF3 [Thiomicrorhabdus sp.]|nr:NGG1p interacting factor NIF3 [Thiomicrorhabdus sp.]
MYKITFYVPDTHLEKVKTAMFAAGAGKIGHYDQCAWQVKGEGQFRPLAGSNAFLGEVNRVEKVEEYRVEMVVDKPFIKKVVVALKQAHPYETPAFDVIETITSFS